jgi:hypothetical protein
VEVEIAIHPAQQAVVLAAVVLMVEMARQELLIKVVRVETLLPIQRVVGVVLIRQALTELLLIPEVMAAQD